MASKYAFRINTDDLEELNTYHQAPLNASIVWELNHNFAKKARWAAEAEVSKNPELSFTAGVEMVLEMLKKELHQ